MSDYDSDARNHACRSVPDNRAIRLQAGLNRAALAGLAVVLAGCLFLQSGLMRGWLVPPLAFGLLWLALGPLLRTHHHHGRIGAANTITLIRAALVCVLIAPLLSGQAGGWAVAALSTVALMLDGVDGWLARRSGLSSAFGARFDVEVDAAMAMVLTVHAWLGTAAGAEVLAIGAMRYLFVAAAWRWPWLSAPLPPRFSRKAVCVVELAALVLLQLPGLPELAVTALVWSTLALLIWSFAVDVIWLRARRA